MFGFNCLSGFSDFKTFSHRIQVKLCPAVTAILDFKSAQSIQTLYVTINWSFMCNLCFIRLVVSKRTFSKKIFKESYINYNKGMTVISDYQSLVIITQLTFLPSFFSFSQSFSEKKLLLYNMDADNDRYKVMTKSSHDQSGSSELKTLDTNNSSYWLSKSSQQANISS